MSERKLENVILENQLIRVLGISKATARKWRQRGCPFLVIGNTRAFFEDELLAWLEKNQRKVWGQPETTRGMSHSDADATESEPE